MPRIAVIGAGLMGHGIAQGFALAGHDVAIYDSFTANLDSAKARILGNLRDLGDDQSAVERVRPTADLAAAVRCRLCRRGCARRPAAEAEAVWRNRTTRATTDNP